jgi:hypothetical protein
MTVPEANQQQELWVDRCRQQLERGAAGNALVAWMQSEGVSADVAAAILQTARDGPPAESGPPARADAAPDAVPEPAVRESAVPDSMAPQGEVAASLGADTGLPIQDGASAETAAAATPAQPVPSPNNAAADLAKAFGRPGKTAHGETTPAPPVPSQPNAAPTVEPTAAATVPDSTGQTVPPQEPPAVQQNFGVHPESPVPCDPATPAAMPVAQPAAQTEVPQDESLRPPAPPSVVPPNPFGTPRPPIVFPPVPAPTDEIPHDDDAGSESSSQETPAAMETGDDLRREVDASPGNETDEVLFDESDPPATEPDPEFGTDADHLPDGGAPAAAAHEDQIEDPEISAPGELEAPADSLDPLFDHDEAKFAEDESADSVGAEFDASENSPSAVPAAEVPEPSHEEPEPDEASPDMAAPDEPYHFEDSLEEAASRMGMDLRQSPHETPDESCDDFADQERQLGQKPSDKSAEDSDVEPTNESGVEPNDQPDGTVRKAARGRTFGRRDSGGSRTVDTDDADDGGHADSIRDAGRQEPDPRPNKSAESSKGELTRAIREAERSADREPDPKTEEELAAAAKELGISFRDDPGTGLSGAPDEPETEMTRAARELGISFRDDPTGPDPMDRDETTIKAAQELGINFRDDYPPEVDQKKSLLVRFWPIILAIVLAAIAMPIAAVYLMFAGS